MLPNRSGYDFCQAVRRDHTTPIIFLSARASDADRVKGLDLGADDYVTKPFNLAELAARVKAVLRRAAGEQPKEAVISGDLSIDPRTHEARLGEKELSLSPKEFALLYFMVKNPRRISSASL
jgi:two-component system OmpR family response regulator